MRVVAGAGDFPETHGIRELRGPEGLVQIEAYSYDALCYASAGELVLDEDAAYLAVADPDVVGPFDACPDALRAQVVAEPQGGGAGYQKYVAGG